MQFNRRWPPPVGTHAREGTERGGGGPLYLAVSPPKQDTWQWSAARCGRMALFGRAQTEWYKTRDMEKERLREGDNGTCN